MQVFESALKLPLNAHRSRVILLGNFDGFHLGHQALLNRALGQKQAAEAITIFTFEPHPVEILRPDGDHRRLWGPQERREFLQNKRVDELIEQRFDHALAQLEPLQFFEKYILPLNPRVVITGNDFRFGKDRKGDREFLINVTKEKGIIFEASSLVEHGDDGKVSTSKIKEKFLAGDFKAGLILLGHEYFIIGDVVKGDQRGRTIGFPTANLKTDFSPSLRFGVYAISAVIFGKKVFGVMNVGVTPTFKSDYRLKLEAHFFNFSGDLYDKSLKVEIVDFIRAEKKFNSKEELVQQIQNDVATARKIHNI